MSFAPLEATWLQPKAFERYYELRDGDQLLATLTFEGLISTLATVDSPLGCWTFEEAGILDQRVLVHESGSGLEAAIFHPKLLGDGTLQLADGRALRWRSLNFWATDWCFEDETASQPVSFRSGTAGARLRDLFKTQATVALDQANWQPAELMMLICLGWYLILRRQQKAAVVVAAT